MKHLHYKIFFSCCFLPLLLCSLPPALPARSLDLDDFKSDGCTLFPDGTIMDRQKWCDCCFMHDITYWRGGTEEQMKRADEALEECIRARTGNSMLAAIMFIGVRAGGRPVFPTWYRWGFGWKYGRGYTPLTDQERTEADRKLAEYYKSHPGGYCAEREAAPVR